MLFGGMKQGMIPVYIETLIMTNDDEGFEHGGIREGATSGLTSNEPCASATIYHLIVKSYQLLVKWPLLHCSRSAGRRKWHLRMRAVNLIFFIVQNNY